MTWESFVFCFDKSYNLKMNEKFKEFYTDATTRIAKTGPRVRLADLFTSVTFYQALANT